MFSRSIARAAALALFAAAPAGAQQRSVTVLQLNDVYRIDAVRNGTAGGIGRVVTLARQARAAGGDVLVLHSGDAIAPSLESRYFGGLQMIDALNHVADVAPMLFVPGNHEFDASSDTIVANAIKASRFPWLAGNVTFATRDSAANGRVGRDTVIALPGGMRLGIFTLTFLDSPRGYARPDSNFVADAERMIRSLEARRADVIVGLTHLAHETDREISRLRARHPRFAWIAGGHEHFRIVDPGTSGTALITKGESNARGIWRVTLSARGGRATAREEAVTVDERIAVDSVYQREVTERWAAGLREKVPFLDAVIGRSDTLMDAREETVRNAESAWADWLADQMRTAFPSRPADIAVLNGGALRIDDEFGGPIRWEHLARTFGFPTRIGLVSLRGTDVHGMLEHSVSGGRGEGRFLQVSGLKVRFDRSRPEGQRVVDVQVQRGTAWAPLADDSVYVVAAPDYVLGGGDGYVFARSGTDAIPFGPDLRLLAFDALAAAYARGQAISPRVEGRIVDLTPR